MEPQSTSEAPSPPQNGDPQGDGAVASATPTEAAMSFLDHLEELRWSLLKGFGGVLAAIIACSFFSGWIIENVLLGPTHADFFMYSVLGIENPESIQLLNRTLTGQFFAQIGAIAAVGTVAGSPIFVYFMWKFVEPGLYPEERQGLTFAALAATFFFVLGICFGYLVITPIALQFFEGWTISENIVNEFDISKYFSMVTFWAFSIGVLFELPVVVYFLTKVGLVTPYILREYRRYALLTVLVIGAFFTPPDPFSQMLVAVPLLLLYEGSVYVSVFAQRRRRKKMREAGVEPET